MGFTDIFLQKNVIENKELNSDGLAVYTILRKIINSEEKEYSVSYSSLAFNLTGKFDFSKRFIKHIKDGLQNLIDIKLIHVVSTIGSNEFVLNLSGLFFKLDDDYFIKVYLSEIRSIMQSKKDKFNLLKCFIFTIGTLDSSKFIYTGIESKNISLGFMTQDYLGKLCAMTQVQYGQYANELFDLGVLYIKRNEDFYLDNDTPKRVNNVYGRFRDKENIDKFSAQYLSLKNTNKCNKNITLKQANYKKSLAMKYNALSNGKIYSQEEMLEIYEYILNRNKLITSKINKIKNQTGVSSDHLEKLENKLKDMSVFNNLKSNQNTEE